MTGGRAIWMRQRKYAVLLALLLVALAIETFSARGAERILSDTFATVLSVATWFVVFERPRERTAMAAVLVAAIAIGWGRRFAAGSLDHAISIADQTVQLLLLCSACSIRPL